MNENQTNTTGVSHVGNSSGPLSRPMRGQLIAMLLTVCCLFATGTAPFAVSPCAAQWIERSDLVSPLIDGDPFDLIILNKNAGNAILKVLPLGDKVPQGNLPAAGVLTFEFFEDGEDILEVPWESVEQISRFKDLLIAEADDWKEKKEFPKAFRNLLWVYDHGGKSDPELVSSLKNLMFEDGRRNFETGEFELALSIYEDIYQQNPSWRPKGLSLIHI